VQKLPAAPESACVTQTFPLLMGGPGGFEDWGKINTTDPDVSKAVMLDTEQKFRSTSRKGNVITIGVRYIGGKKENGLAWTPLSSTSVKKTIGVICEGPIEGLVDENGEFKEYDYTAGPNISTDYLKGIYINDVPIKNTQSNTFNIPKFDFDMATSSKKITMPATCEGEAISRYMIGSNDQRLLKKQYLYAGTTYDKNSILYGPRVDDPASDSYKEAEKQMKNPEEEFFVSHVVTNPNVAFSIVSLRIDELMYIYEGDESRVTIKLGSLLGALLGAMIAWVAIQEVIDWTGLAASMFGQPPLQGPDVVEGRFAMQNAQRWTGWGAAALVLAVALLGAIIGNNLKLYSGRKIENSGETWPNKLKFRIKVSNEGSPEQEYVTNIQTRRSPLRPSRASP